MSAPKHMAKVAREYWFVRLVEAPSSQINIGSTSHGAQYMVKIQVPQNPQRGPQLLFLTCCFCREKYQSDGQKNLHQQCKHTLKKTKNISTRPPGYPDRRPTSARRVKEYATVTYSNNCLQAQKPGASNGLEHSPEEPNAWIVPQGQKARNKHQRNASVVQGVMTSTCNPR